MSAAFTSPHLACTIGHIVMTYIDSPVCSDDDREQVARAVRTLVGIEARSCVPGHFGGGAAVHGLLNSVLWMASCTKYEARKELENRLDCVSEQ